MSDRTKIYTYEGGITLSHDQDEYGGGYFIGKMCMATYITASPPRWNTSGGTTEYCDCPQEKARFYTYGLFAQITGIDPETGEDYE